MIYRTKKQCDLECRLNERAIGGKWEARLEVHGNKQMWNAVRVDRFAKEQKS